MNTSLGGVSKTICKNGRDGNFKNKHGSFWSLYPKAVKKKRKPIKFKTRGGSV